jgi:hypothetical protein
MKTVSTPRIREVPLDSVCPRTALKPGGDSEHAPTGSVPVSHERHYSPSQIAAMWNLSEDKVRRIFEREPGSLVLENRRPGKRRYRTLRIPESVAQRVHLKLSLS